jgi:hypothetical protein
MELVSRNYFAAVGSGKYTTFDSMQESTLFLTFLKYCRLILHFFKTKKGKSHLI